MGEIVIAEGMEGELNFTLPYDAENRTFTITNRSTATISVNDIKIDSGKYVIFCEVCPIPHIEKNAKLNKAKAQYQKLNDWRNKRKR